MAGVVRAATQRYGSRRWWRRSARGTRELVMVVTGRESENEWAAVWLSAPAFILEGMEDLRSRWSGGLQMALAVGNGMRRGQWRG